MQLELPKGVFMPTLVPSLNFVDVLSPFDWLVFALVLVCTGASVLYGEWKKRREVPDEESASFLDLLIMGRQLTLPLFVGTLVATWYGGIFGVTQIAFEKGVYNFVTQGLFWYAAYIIFAFFIVDKIAPFKAVTLPDLLEKMFGPKAAKLGAVFNFFNVLPVAYAISLGIFIKVLFPLSLGMAMAIGVLLTLSYSIWGGLRAVVYSDLIQFFVMCSAVFLIIVFAVSEFGGISYLQQQLPSTHFELTGGQGLATTFVWGLIALSTLVDPNFYQRCFAAKSPQTAKRGILISTGIWFLFDICTTLGAMYARAAIPSANPQEAYLTFALQILPSGLRGFVLAGILATILSTLDSYLFQAGTTVAYDLAPKKMRGKVWAHHLGMTLVGGLAVLIGLWFEGNIARAWKTLGSYSAACLLLPVMVGYIFPKKISDNQFVTSCLVGVVATTYWKNATLSGWWANVDELYIGALATGLGLALFSLAATKRP
jgi:SSS family solute:Na+ symporter